MIIILIILSAALFFVCRDNNKYADELTAVLKKTNKE